MSHKLHRPELLAPAGTIEAGLTAFDAGADAVYAGLPRFNARERGQNLSTEELSKLIGEAHTRGHRVYVTLNTLIKEWEIDEVSRWLVDLVQIRPDAIIVQDIGLLRLIRRHFPELELHASTQMAIHNSAGLEVAQRLGISRVILERQSTLEEIKSMSQWTQQTGLELEVFVHGALCCSRSGLCLFSSWMGGWSGNRGRCKQPCRRRYHSNNGNGFFFSPTDLCALEDIPKLKSLGIAGLKIEGRLRKPDYVRRVVTAYRMVLDSEGDALSPELLGEARGVLAGALGRRWHPLFHDQSDFDDVIRHQAIGASGLLCGKVITVSPTKFEVAVSRPLHRYDTIRVQPRGGEEGPSMTLKRLAVGRKKVRKIRKGESCWIDSTQSVEVGSLVFKTGSATSDLSERVSGLSPARPVLDIEVKLSRDMLHVNAPLLGESWEKPVDLSPAKSRPVVAESLIEQFRKTSSNNLAAGFVSAQVEGELFLPAGELKKLRREFWSWAESTVSGEALRSRWEDRRGALIKEHRSLDVGASPPSTATVILGPSDPSHHHKSRVARGIWDLSLLKKKVLKGVDEVVLPEYCSEEKLPALRKRIAGCIDDGYRRIRVTSLYGFALLAQYDGLEVTASFPLPVCNSSAVEALRELGASKVMAWVELERAALDALVKGWGGLIEVLTYGRLPLLTTRFALPAEGRVTDGRGAKFTLMRERGLSNLYPERVLSVVPPDGASTVVDLTHAKPEEELRSDFNDSRELA